MARDLGDKPTNPSFLYKIVAYCFPVYRALTRVTLRDGRRCSFWMVKWRTGAPLFLRFPALFSHTTRPHASVATVVASGLDLQPHLTAAAELLLLQDIIATTTLHDGADSRPLDSDAACPPGSTPFSSREAYRMFALPRPPDPDAGIYWGLSVLTKVKIFAYLASIDRLNTRANLLMTSSMN